jgi:hypothetical protein
MDEPGSLKDEPLTRAGGERPNPLPEQLAASAALQILTAEHSSLTAARGLVYNEAFARAGMFLTFLSASLVALGFIFQGTENQDEFLIVAIALLAFDLLIGLGTLGRVSAASIEEFRAIQAMNRIRRGYVELVPRVGQYLSTRTYDDMPSILNEYGSTTDRPAAAFLHGLTTSPGMIAMIDSVLAGAIVAAAALFFDATPITAIVAAIVVFSFVFGAFAMGALRFVGAVGRRFEVRFPPPTE